MPEDRVQELWKIVEYGSDLAKKPLLVGTHGPSKVRISSNASSQVRILGGIFSGPIFSRISGWSRRSGPAGWFVLCHGQGTFQTPSLLTYVHLPEFDFINPDCHLLGKKKAWWRAAILSVLALPGRALDFT